MRCGGTFLFQLDQRGGEGESTDHQPRQRRRADLWETGRTGGRRLRKAHCGVQSQNAAPGGVTDEDRKTERKKKKDVDKMGA